TSPRQRGEVGPRGAAERPGEGSFSSRGRPSPGGGPAARSPTSARTAGRGEDRASFASLQPAAVRCRHTTTWPGPWSEVDPTDYAACAGCVFTDGWRKCTTPGPAPLAGAPKNG